MEEEFKAFKNYFSEEYAQIVFYFAMVRWAYNAPMKRTTRYYNEDFCSESFKFKAISDKNISTTLRFVGENRTKLMDWKKSLIDAKDDAKSEYLMIDSTHITSMSALLHTNAVGYNPQKQIRLMYIFSSELHIPIYYKAINGNITDVKSMKMCVEEMKLKNVIYIGDKGFYSKDNVNQMDSEGLQYIIPLYRNNFLIDLAPLLDENFKKKMNYFLYQKRIIWYFEYEKDSQKLITFLDESLKTSEEADYLERIENNVESFSKEKFIKKIGNFGTLTMIYKTNQPKKPDEIYKAYKRRNQVELTFDAYKNFLKADTNVHAKQLHHARLANGKFYRNDCLL
jgi:transposase